MNQLRVFVSSTCYDLSDIRAGLFDFILSQGHQPILSEYNSFPIDPDNGTIENCIENVKTADIFILILGNRYGFMTESGKSITNTEYLYAKENAVPTYVFISNSLVTLMSEWENDRGADFSNKVDSIKLFEFTAEVRSENKKWCFTFENVGLITETLKIQFSHLFKQALDVRKKIRISDHPDFYQFLSAKALKILFERDLCYEAEFFGQVMKDEIEKHESLKLDLEYKILTSCSREVRDISELVNWMNVDFQTMMYLVDSINSLFNNAFKKFYAEPGVPSDLKGLYYVACSIARIFKEMMEWSINIKSVKVDDDFILVRDSLSDFITRSIEEIWSYPTDALTTLRESIKKYKETNEPMKIEATLTLVMDDDNNRVFHSEMARLNQKLLNGF